MTEVGSELPWPPIFGAQLSEAIVHPGIAHR
jgi:hypothetical protein